MGGGGGGAELEGGAALLTRPSSQLTRKQVGEKGHHARASVSVLSAH